MVALAGIGGCQPPGAADPASLDGSSQTQLSLTARKTEDFGCVECVGPEQLVNVRHLSLAADGTVYVLCGSTPFVRVFNAREGERSPFAFGNAGEGPGELSLPAYVYPRRDGSALVYNAMPGRLLIVDGTTGELLAMRTVPTRVPTNASFEPTTDSLALATMSPLDVGGTRVGMLTVVDESEPTTVLDGARLPPEYPDRSRHLFSMAVGPGPVLAVGFSWDYRIRYFDAGGRFLREVSREIERTRKTQAEIERDRESSTRFQAAIGSAEPAFDVLTERHHFGKFALDFDEAGRLWVLTTRGGDDGAIFDVFGPDGEYLGELVLPVAIPERSWRAGNVFDFHAGRLAAVTVNEDDYEFVSIWQIE